VEFTASQAAFVNSTATFPAFVGGFGSGKTAAGIARIMKLKLHCPEQDVAYYLPTYPLIEDIAFQRFPVLFERNGIDYKLNKQRSLIETNLGRILFRNMEHPDRIVGYEVAHSLLDELDTLPVKKATAVWNKVIARNRQKAFTASGKTVKNTVSVATTPEGFRFVHERWVKKGGPKYQIIKARTMENAANLPEDYIENLMDSYEEAQLLAYLDGEFVNLTSGSVYASFDRRANQTFETIQEGDHLHVGMDFNVTNMSAVISVLRQGKPHVVAELTGLFDTPDIIGAIKAKWPDHPVTVYPDASGGARKTVQASASDISLLRAARFTVLVNSRNPAVKDRVTSVNVMLKKGELFVNPDTCPVVTESLERQAYNDAGTPDKEGGYDHTNDALGYFIVFKFGVATSRVTLVDVGGI
jgi:hypothetical protein